MVVGSGDRDGAEIGMGDRISMCVLRFCSVICDFPTLTHWSILSTRLNGWLKHSFSLLITLLDMDGTGQNWEDSNSRVKSCL